MEEKNCKIQIEVSSNDIHVQHDMSAVSKCPKYALNIE